MNAGQRPARVRDIGRLKTSWAQRPVHKFFKSLNALGYAASLAKNSLRSNSISYFVAQIADAIRDSISIQRICIPLKTSSCGNRLCRFACRRMFFNSPYIPHPQYYFSASDHTLSFRRPATHSRRYHGSPVGHRLSEEMNIPFKGFAPYQEIPRLRSG